MTEPIKPRARLTQTSLTSPTLPSPTTFQPRVRAKVDLSSIATPPAQSRPSLRTTPSSASFRSTTSSTSDIRARSPVPPHVRLNTPPITPTFPSSRPSSSRSNDSTPITQVRAKTLVRTASPDTPGMYRTPTATGGESSTMRPPSRAGMTNERGRVKVRTLPSNMLSNSSPLLSRDSLPSPLQLEANTRGTVQLNTSPDRLTSSSNHSSPGKPTIQLPAYLNAILTTTSCPSTPHPPFDHFPLPIQIARPRKMPYNPHSNHPPPLPPPPLSPELKPVALPTMTPRRVSDEDSPSLVGSGSEVGAVRRIERDRLSGSTAVDEDLNGYEGGHGIGIGMGKEVEVDVVLGTDAEEAKINRKVADLEISNASLMAINRSLEATKAKQRSEILKLRRALRDSLSGTTPSTSLLTIPLNSPSNTPFSPSMEEGGDYFDEEMVDPELEGRWERISELVVGMRRRGEGAVSKGREEVRTGQRVLGWMDVEQGEGAEEGNSVERVGVRGEEGERDVPEG